MNDYKSLIFFYFAILFSLMFLEYQFRGEMSVKLVDVSDVRISFFLFITEFINEMVHILIWTKCVASEHWHEGSISHNTFHSPFPKFVSKLSYFCSYNCSVIINSLTKSWVIDSGCRFSWKLDNDWIMTFTSFTTPQHL